MTRFIFKRLGIALGVLAAATFFFFLLAANAGDPLEDLRASQQKNREQLIEARTQELNLDVAVPVRYFYWAGSALQGDLGNDYKTGQEVTSLIEKAVGQTLKLIGFSTIAGIVIGVTLGVISALRQYTGFDYGMTFVNLLLYSLPSFWIAVLLKQWGAIGFNDFLADPHIPPLALAIIAVALAVVIGSAVGGKWRSRLIVGGIVGVSSAAVLAIMDATSWFSNPGLGPIVILILGVGAAYAVTFLTAGLSNRKVLLTTLIIAATGAIAWFPFQTAFGYTDGLVAFIQLVAFIGAGIGLGFALRGPDAKVSARAGAITGGIVYGLLWLDNLISYWEPYTNTAAVNGRPIATVGSATPQLADNTNFWVGTLDTYTHLVLPVMAIILISVASYTRYMRSSMLEVMNLDYIRTARAKGLPERVVVMRHGFRNALIPLATIIPLDLASLVGGAVITETVFGWSGMGRLFVEALHEVNINVLMGYFLVVGVLLIVGNLLADLLYAILDPRIRVDA